MSEKTAKMKNTADRATIIHERVQEVRYKLIESLSKAKRFQKKNSAVKGTTI